VASLEHRPQVVETRHAGGIGRRGLVRVSLRRAWGLQLDPYRPTSCRGAGEATGAKRLLSCDQAIRGEALAGATPLCIPLRKLSKRPCCDSCEAIPFPGVLTIPLRGAGTSMLAQRLTTILPAMTLAEALETTRIHSVADLTGDR
jgi:hypothetical protein